MKINQGESIGVSCRYYWWKNSYQYDKIVKYRNIATRPDDAIYIKISIHFETDFINL